MSHQKSPHCNSCHWILQFACACPSSQSYFIFSLISIIPYLIAFYFILRCIVRRHHQDIKITLLLVTGYIFSNHIIKNIVADLRPYGSCHVSYGFPSSHVVITTFFACYFFLDCNIVLKFFLILLVMAQGYSRVHLNYHTMIQVLGGILFGIIYSIIFNIIYQNTKISQLMQKCGVRNNSSNKNIKITKNK